MPPRRKKPEVKFDVKEIKFFEEIVHSKRETAKRIAYISPWPDLVQSGGRAMRTQLEEESATTRNMEL